MGEDVAEDSVEVVDVDAKEFTDFERKLILQVIQR